MNNSSIFEIQILPKGMDEVSKVPAVINQIGSAVNLINTSMNPLSQIVNILTDIKSLLTAVGKVGVESFNKLDQIFVTTNDGFKKSTIHADKLDKQIEEIGKTSNKAGSEVKKGLLDRLAEFGQAFIGIKAAAQTVWGAVAPIFEEGMMRQNAETDFATILGIPDPEEAKKAAKKYADDLRGTDTAALYGTSTVNEGAKSMIAYGVDPETTFQMLESLGDIAMGDKQKLNSLSTAFSQMFSLGKLQTQDWKQMVGAGFNPFPQLSKDLGKTTEQLDEMMSKGKISAEQVKNAFMHATSAKYYDIEGKVRYAASKEDLEKAQKEFEKAAQEQWEKNGQKGEKKEWKAEKVEKGMYFGSMTDTMNNTLTGAVATMQGAIDDLKAKVFENIMPVAIKLVNIVKDSLLPLFNKFMPVLTDYLVPAISKVFDLLEPLLNFVSENLDVLGVFAGVILTVAGAMKVWAGIQAVINALLTANPVGLVVVAIAALIAIVYKCIDAWDKWGAALSTVLGTVGMVVNLVMTLKTHWTSIKEAFEKGTWDGLKRLGVVLLDFVLKPMSQILEAVANFTGWDWAKNLSHKVQQLRFNLELVTPEELKVLSGDGEKESGTQKELEDTVNKDTKGGNGLGDGSNAAKGTEKVASGGTRNTQITITLGNLVGTMAFNGGLEENREQVETNATDLLLRVLYSAAYAAE